MCRIQKIDVGIVVVVGECAFNTQVFLGIFEKRVTLVVVD